jgi:hypothetical protein
LIDKAINRRLDEAAGRLHDEILRRSGRSAAAAMLPETADRVLRSNV